MWTYDQRSGRLTHNGNYVAKGYAGCGLGKNNPSAQSSKGTPIAGKNLQHLCRPGAGPLPRGLYKIGPLLIQSPVGRHAMRLTPEHHHGSMFGRNDFYIHGDNRRHIGKSSDGCIVVPFPSTRDYIAQIANSGTKDNTLKVIG